MADNLRILILDDDERMAKTLSDILTTKGYAPIACNSGKRALDEVKKDAPPVALIDLKLENVSGLEVMKKIKEYSPQTECIILTGYASQESAIQAVNLGAYNYVKKPYDVKQLVLTIQRALEKNESKKVLQESEEKYRILVENANEVIIVVQEGKIKFANSKTIQLSGYSRDEVISKSFVEFIHPDDRKIVAECHLKRLKGEKLPFVYSFRFINKEGNIRWLEINAVRIDWMGKPATLNFLTDVTKRKMAEEELHQSYHKLQKAMNSTVKAMARTVELRDPYTAGHQNRVTQLAFAIAKEMSLSKDRIAGIRMAATIHDIGKLHIPAEILSKPTQLTKIEFDMLKTHPRAGYNILKGIEFSWPIAKIVLQHHERMNGSGYPQGLKDDAILLEARILAVADVLEAMSSHRPYRPALGTEKALEEIKKNRNVLYDFKVSNACLKLFTQKKFTFKQ